MHDSDLRLDGNAASGLLSEVFAAEASTAIVVCASCGGSGALGSALVYDQGPGLVIRCSTCSAVLMRFARIRTRLVADLRGCSTVALEADA